MPQLFLFLLFCVISKGSASYEGTSFVVAFNSPGRNETGRVYIMNRYPATSCTVTSGNRTDTFRVAGSGQTDFSLPLDGHLLDKTRGILIECKRKVQVYIWFGTGDLSLESATPLIPVHSLSTEYSVPLMSEFASVTTVVAISDNTKVVVKLKSTQASIRGKLYKNGEEVQFLLDKLDVLQLTTGAKDSSSPDTSFNQTLIRSDKPVAVFSGYTAVLSQFLSTFQTLHQIVPATYLGSLYILPTTERIVVHDMLITAHRENTNVTLFSCYGASCTTRESYTMGSSSSGLFKLSFDVNETSAVVSSAPVTVVRLVNYHALVIIPDSSVVPPVSQYGYDYWIPNIQPSAANVSRNITVVTYPTCVPAFKFAAIWQNITFGSNTFSLTNIQVPESLTRLTTSPECRFAVEVSFVAEHKNAAYGFFAVPLDYPAGQADPTVHAPWGQIKGVQQETDDLTPYNVYYAIPYALPPTGHRRFTKPIPHPGIQGRVFNAKTPGPSCIQASNMQFGYLGPQDEDCLTLDVYTPASSVQSDNLPVIVYIHGGGFVVGSSVAFSAGAMSAKGVIIVVIQYRLGPFGFLSTGDAAALGNYGLWDQHMAIQWVNRNIKAFGGDVKRITLMGESAGSASVSFQVLYEGSKGLFQRIIMQSGSATSTWAVNRDPIKTAYKLAHDVGCAGISLDHSAGVNCLRAASVSAISKASWPMGNDPVTSMTEFYFVPTVDGEFVKDDPMILVNSHIFLTQVGLQNLDVMVAVNSNEGGLLLSMAQLTDKVLGTSMESSLVNRTFYKSRLIPHLLDLYFDKSTSNMADVVDFELTFPDTKSAVIDLQKVLDTSADPSIVVPTIQFASAHASLNSSRQTFMYYFDHTPTFLPHVVEGLLHGQDLYYAFGLDKSLQKTLNISSISQDEKRLSDIFISLVTGFARTGDPSPAVRSYSGTDWPKFTAANQEYFVLSTKPYVSSHPLRRRYSLWTELLPEMLMDWQIATNMTTSQKGKLNGPLVPFIIG